MIFFGILLLLVVFVVGVVIIYLYDENVFQSLIFAVLLMLGAVYISLGFYNLGKTTILQEQKQTIEKEEQQQLINDLGLSEEQVRLIRKY